MFMMWSVDNVVFLISILFYFQILVFQKKHCFAQYKESRACRWHLYLLRRQIAELSRSEFLSITYARTSPECHLIQHEA